MNRIISRVGTLLAVAFAAGTAQAQDLGFDAAFKARAGFGFSSKDQLSRKAFGLGFEVGYGSRFGRLGLELGYQYKPGNQVKADLAAMPTAPGMTVDPSQSVDSRKSQLSGLMARLSYEKQLGQGPFALRLGVQAGGASFRQEYIGDVTDGTSYEDTYNGTATKTTVPMSPFAGLRYDLDKEQSLEVNVVALAYTSVNYVHVAGSVANPYGGHTALDYLETRKRSVPHVELCYVIRF